MVMPSVRSNTSPPAFIEATVSLAEAAGASSRAVIRATEAARRFISILPVRNRR